MESLGKKKPRPRRSFTPEFKAEIVELCRRGPLRPSEVAWRGQPGGVPGTWGHHFDDCLLLRTAAHLAADHGSFNLVLAGGLFDYLEERFTRALIRTTLSRLCRPGDTFYFSDIATPNPYAALMTHIGRWNLVERTPRRHRGRRPRRRAAGEEPSPDRTSPPMPPA